ncbi:heavy-metal-associated domain-containing protein [Mucilaginibacter robiniae]|uniref:Heavy-metal-associated domain-containing protein n=1 Tax=Mucilaginibacter robiniae TaxID=2728022 RepID=A0A7L5E353_9SPHI|nr:heavy-metal-associated domain-containing protein [Mucilaginibacter robiniae]QJD96084.1 heavy-metal-associated domain-containing protein [Mucilaginibacter robiniae]
MQTLKFKTNINCSSCIASVTTALNSVKGVQKWDVDTASPKKILTITADGIKPDIVIGALKEKGFTAEIN